MSTSSPKKTPVLVISGPNLNMLGKRDASHYGKGTLEDLGKMLAEAFPDFEFTFFHSNHEGEIIDKIHHHVETNDLGALIYNMGGFTHTSVAIHDALELLKIPKIEVHLSNIHAREEFRHKSVTAAAADGVIAGFGPESYILAAEALRKRLS